jgi:hypothetical protein
MMLARLACSQQVLGMCELSVEKLVSCTDCSSILILACGYLSSACDVCKHSMSVHLSAGGHGAWIRVPGFSSGCKYYITYSPEGAYVCLWMSHLLGVDRLDV